MRVCAVALTALLAACASGPSVEEPRPPGAPHSPAPMPPIPLVDGPLQLTVAYPPEGAGIAVRDSNFIFGATGSGRASLTINGAPVEVKPNGGWLAFLPVPSDGVYTLRATRGTDTASYQRTVRVTAAAVSNRATGAYIVRGSVTPTGSLAVRSGENVEFSMTATPGGQAWLLLPNNQRYPLLERGVVATAANNAADFETQVPSMTTSQAQYVRYSGLVPALALRTADSSVARPTIGTFPDSASRDSLNFAPRVLFIQGTDTATAPLSVNIATLDVPRVAVVTDTASVPTREWRIRGRPTIGGPFHYFWPNGTKLTVVGERAGFYRVQLGGNLHAWVPRNDVRLLPAGTPPAGGAVSVGRFIPQADYIDLRLGVPDRLPYHVEETENGLQIDVFGASSQLNFFQYGKYDTLIERAVWSQPSEGVFRVNVTLNKPVWGYDTFHDGNAVVLRIRRPPTINPVRPLAGLRILVDPGHGGRDTATTGPTGFKEAHANLAISLALRPMLEAAGAHVIMTRSTNVFVELGDRTKMATDSNAHILVSVHNNAFPDGVNPFVNNGTSVYYYHPHSVDLTQLLLREIVAELGLRDIGYGRADLALVRPTWMPASLTETSFMMVPEQEAALRHPQWQERVARAHVRALEAFLRKRASQ